MMLTRQKQRYGEAESLKRLLIRTDERPLEAAVMGFQALCMLLLGFKDGDINLFSLMMAALLPLGTYFGLRLITRFWPVDRAMYILTAFLCSLSVILLRAVFKSDEKAHTQALYLLPGYFMLIVGIGVPRILSGREKIIKLMGIAQIF